MKSRKVSNLPVLLSVVLLATIGTASCGSSEPTPTPSPDLSPQETIGSQVYTRNCATCHLLTEDDVKVGPSLFGIGDNAGQRVAGQDAKTYIYTSVLNPSDYVVAGFEDLMPQNLAKVLTGEELDAVVAYLLTLKK